MKEALKSAEANSLIHVDETKLDGTKRPKGTFSDGVFVTFM